jgi:alkylation response protein AidB-like acyl-CoA dehydrogenase
MFERDDYTADQRALAEFVEQLAEEFDYTYFLENMRKGEFPRRFWDVLCAGGYLGILAPEEHGGAGSKIEDLVVLVHNLARKGMASHQLLNQVVCCDLLTRYGSDAQQRRHLPEFISGSLCALALMERAEGMDLFDLDMSAARDAESFRLAGTKRYVAGAREASRMLVVARTGPKGEGDRKQGLSLFSVDPQQQGIAMVARELSVRVTADEELVLITGDTFFDVAFDDLELSRGDLVGEEGLGADAVIDASNLLFILTAVTAIGWGESVLEKAIEHAKTRAVFEDPIGSYQAIQHPMVRAKTELELAKLAIARAVSAYDKRDADLAVYASVAKCAATEAAYCACDISLQALGGGGFDRETGVITLWPLILLSRILPLNNEVILERFAEAALDLPVGVGA